VFCIDDSIQLRVVLYPTVVWLVKVLLALVGWPHTRKVVVILFSIKVHSAVRVLAEWPVYVIMGIVDSVRKRYSGMVPATQWLFLFLFDEGDSGVWFSYS
jgi:hypothetical protein